MEGCCTNYFQVNSGTINITKKRGEELFSAPGSILIKTMLVKSQAKVLMYPGGVLMTKVADRLWTAEVPVALCTCILLGKCLIIASS